MMPNWSQEITPPTSVNTRMVEGGMLLHYTGRRRRIHWEEEEDRMVEEGML